jgi:hypothetical protein
MYSNYKVKVFIFAGRQQTMTLLMSQLRDPVIDEIIIAKNTMNKSDLAYLDSLKKTYDTVRYIELPAHIKQDRHNAWKWLYQFMDSEDTIYFKIDDDVIYIEPGYFEKTCKFKLDHPEYLCIFPMVINNPFCNTLRKDTPLGNATKPMWDRLYAGFYSSDIATMVHRDFLMRPFHNTFKVPNKVIGPEHVYFRDQKHPHMVSNMVDWWYAERIAINAICFLGSDFKKLDVRNKIQKCYSDELWLTYNVFDHTKQRHCVYGDTLVSHFAFSAQTGLRNNGSILQKYQDLIKRVYQ